jgi:hypothetical protein
VAQEVAPYIAEAQEHISKLRSKEEILGKALMQPFADCNSGNRKLMFSVHVEQSLPLLHAQVPFIQTGYEQGFSDRSSSIITADANYEVVAKISKFKSNPQHHYYLILRNLRTNALRLYERKEYLFTQETYGYEYDNSILDSLDVSYEVREDELLRKSTAYDEYQNPRNSVNLLATYVATDVTMEDSMWISQSAQEKLSSNLYKKVTVNVNDNDILLNLMGDANHYKSFPNIGEKVKGGILCAIRREKIEDSLFTQSVEMLQTILMSDDKYTPGDNGIVIDIDVHCNNPELLKTKYSNSQVLAIYNEHLEFISEFVTTVNELMYRYHISETELGTNDYELGRMYYNFKRELSGAQFTSQKVYSGTQLEFIVKEINVPSIGDKISNRYGGKGVIAKIMPDDQMPRVALTGQPLEILINSSTCVNRLNPGQWHEMSLTHIGKCIVDLAALGFFDTTEALHEIVKFVSFCSPSQAQEMATSISTMSEEDRDIYLQSIIDDGNIIISIKPLSESMDLDVLSELYDAFPYITQRQILMPIVSSTGAIRFVPARRLGVVGHLAMYRLQQYAEEKHSVTALSSTNIRNENSRNKANKYYKATHQATPVNFGDMECGDLGHAGFENVITMLMIHSVSPHARRLVEQIYTGDPYLVDVKLDEDSSNRSAEILAAYLKSIGYKLVFEKVRKKISKPFRIKPFYVDVTPRKKPFAIFGPNVNIDIDKYNEWVKECNEKIKRKPFLVKPFLVHSDQYDPEVDPEKFVIRKEQVERSK